MSSSKGLDALAMTIARGFAQVSERLENDIGILARQISQLAEHHTRDLDILGSQINSLSKTTANLSKTTAKELTYLSVNSARLSARIKRDDPGEDSGELRIASASPQDLAIDLVDGAIRLDFPDFVRHEFPLDFDKAWAATQAILDVLPASDLSPLAKRSPGLGGTDGYEYIRLSLIRLVRVGAALRRSGLTGGRVLDFGSYYGNFSLFLRSLGFDVYAADTYGNYGGAFSKMLPLLHEAGVKVIDLTQERDLASFEPGLFDAVLCMGVIEHVPHTPKPLLLALNRVLRPEGTLVLDTPNLLYVYTRERLAEGKPIFTPIELQFNVEPPFEGHHREYTPSEVQYMLQAIGHEVADLDVYNYSIYELKELTGSDAARYARMAVDPELREVIFTRSIKKT
jgi:2-polyprenyl-3-methyl-5-hydroxy-6-metoxy-1,4-benzoquinol methylase